MAEAIPAKEKGIMKHVNIDFFFTEDLGLKLVIVNHNDTGINSDSELLKRLAVTTLKAIHDNYQDVKIQDLLNDAGIKRS